MKKLLLIYPSVATNPEVNKSIAILNGIARQHGWKIRYFDTYIYEKRGVNVHAREVSGEFKSVVHKRQEVKLADELIADLQEMIDSFSPDLVAISASSYEYNYLTGFLPKISFPKLAKIIIGGIHCVLKPDEVINSGLFDMVCVGDGEEAFDEILTRIDNNLDLQCVENIFFRDRASGEVIKNPRKKLIDESILWTFKPDYSLFSDEYFKYPFHGKIYRRFRFEVGRGCPCDCTYCANSALKKAYKGLGKYYRTRPLETIKSDMEVMLNKYNIELFLLDDECLLAHSKEWLNDFFSWYGKAVRRPFTLQTRPETITEEKIEILKKSNAPFFQIKMGIESGSERILRDVCNRTTKIEQIIHAFEILHKNKDKILSAACFMLGFPFETREDIFKTINLCRKIKPDEIIVSIFQPMPGQRLKDVCIKEGYMKETDNPHFFNDSSILKMPQISQEEIENLRRVFVLYATLPKKYYKKIELCEKDYDGHRDLYKELVELRWGSKK